METMPPLANLLLLRVLARIPGVKRLPAFELLIGLELLMLAKAHYELLSVTDRRRLVELVRETQGKPRNLTPDRRHELGQILSKTEPRMFAGAAARKLSPISVARLKRR